MTSRRPTAIVFAYHNVGVRCLSTLLARGIDIALVVTHRDSSTETIWFASVADLASSYGIPFVTPETPDDPDLMAAAAAQRPDFVFSFYYRQMLRAFWLELPRRGAFNMHGSLLPKYRGRAPVNWAVLKGESETGATLHHMVEKPDAGDIVAQQRVPILPDDTARDVFDKVTVAAELTLHQILPALIEERAPRIRQDLAAGSYFGGRTSEDGRIDWQSPPREIHNLVRAVAPPYPGAFTTISGNRVVIRATRLVENRSGSAGRPALYSENGQCFAQTESGHVLRVLSMEISGQILGADEFSRMGTRLLGYFDSAAHGLQ